MTRKDEFDEIAEWLVFNCSAVSEAIQDGDDDALAEAIADVLREENIGYRDWPKATSAVVGDGVDIQSTPSSASNAAEGLGPNNASQAKGAVDAK